MHRVRMMMLLLPGVVAMIFLTAGCGATREKSVDGVYIGYNQSVHEKTQNPERYFDTVEIVNDRLIIKKSEAELFGGNVVADCRISRADKNFIRAWSTDYPNIAFNDSTVRYSGRKGETDSLRIVIKLPNMDEQVDEEKLNKLKWSSSIYAPETGVLEGVKKINMVRVTVCGICGETEDEYVVEDCSKCVEISVPNRYDRIGLKFTPYCYFVSSRSYYYKVIQSPLYYRSSVEGIDVLGSEIEITLPEVRPSMFRRWLLQGDYIMIKGNELRFRGKIYYKLPFKKVIKIYEEELIRN